MKIKLFKFKRLGKEILTDLLPRFIFSQGRLVMQGYLSNFFIRLITSVYFFGLKVTSRYQYVATNYQGR